VHGVPDLRVADASVFPNLIAGNTNAPAILVGWLAADRMLA
jgi:choline dehydrogenase